MRTFIRHPSSMPIEFIPEFGDETISQNLQDVGEGGLCFDSKIFIPVSTHLKVKIPNLKYPFIAECIVVWCREKKKEFTVGVKFTTKKSANKMRMIEQICYIEKYKELMEKQGRRLSSTQASNEWIEKYAKDFPRLN